MDRTATGSRFAAADHMDAARSARAAGDLDAMRTQLVAAFDAARAAGDTDAMAAAALALPSAQQFGLFPGQIPALLYEAYTATEVVETRCRLASALARSWVYGGDAARAVQFADDAQRLAAQIGRAELVADALDAALVAHWGPDDFADRVSLAARLDDVAAHLIDVDLRVSAHLWRLSTAWECLDIVAVQRQLRALDVIAEESGSARAAFFAESRRAMYALATDDLVGADAAIRRTQQRGAEITEPDVAAVLHELNAARALLAGDLVVLREEAAAHEAFGAAEGIPSISAEAASLWIAAGETERAARLATQLTAAGVEGVARDVDFVLTVTLIVGVAAAAELPDIAGAGFDALEPYAGRAVVNAGAVLFHGVVDDYLFGAARLIGHPDADRWRHAALSAYRRIGAGWWERALTGPPVRRPAPERAISLRRDETGRWSIGPEGRTFTLADLKGLQYLRYLVERPGADLDASILSDAVAGHAGTTVQQADVGPTLDVEAVAAYRSRLVEVDDELDAADLRGDQAGAERLGRERDALLDQLASATGLRGRARRTGSSAERARVAVRKAIANALTQIEREAPDVARLLRDTVHTGTTCRYDPNPDYPVIWITD